MKESGSTLYVDLLLTHHRRLPHTQRHKNTLASVKHVHRCWATDLISEALKTQTRDLMCFLSILSWTQRDEEDGGRDLIYDFMTFRTFTCSDVRLLFFFPR